MTDAACSICGTAYATGRDEDDRPWRSLCRCEAGFRCHRGAHPATHAREIDRKVQYCCDRHGVPLETRAEQALLPPVPVAPERAPRAPAPKPKATKPPVAAVPPPRGYSPEELGKLFADYAELMRCDCGDVHPFNARPWREGEFIATSQTSMFGKGFHPAEHHCPACGLPNVHPETGLATFAPVKEAPLVPHEAPRKQRRR